MSKPTYYAILPAEVRYDEKLSPNQKLLFAEITALANKQGYCSASNAYFADLYNVSKETVSRWISSLKTQGHVSIELIKEGNQVKERRVTLLTKSSIPSPQKDQYPIDKKLKGNNTRKNNTRKNIPTLEEVEQYFDENGYRLDSAKKFYDYYSASIEDYPQAKYWRDAGGRPIKVWKQKARAVWFRPEHKKQEQRRFRI